MSIGKKKRVVVDADLVVQRVEASQEVQDVHISTLNDGKILISSKGTLPRVPLNELRRLKTLAVSVSRKSAQGIVVTHNDEVLAEIKPVDKASPSVSIHWWALLKKLFFEAFSK